MERIDRDDVGVLESGELLRLGEAAGGHLEGDGPVGEVALVRQIDAAEGAAAQLTDDAEAQELLAHFRERNEALGQPGQAGVGVVRLAEEADRAGVAPRLAPGVEAGVRGQAAEGEAGVVQRGGAFAAVPRSLVCVDLRHEIVPGALAAQRRRPPATVHGGVSWAESAGCPQER